MKNRLEQLRKRQRDEALQAQQELLAGVPAARLRANVVDESFVAGDEDTEMETSPEEDNEPYERGMSPPLIKYSKLPYEERQGDVIDELIDRLNLVSSLH